MFTPDQTLAELATSHPAASRVFRSHRLDFCCGGNRSLRDACAERGIPVDTVLQELEAESAEPGPVDPAALPLPDLVEHVLTRFHEAHRRELPELIALAQKVERVHADKPDVPRGLAAHLSEMARALEEHMRKEEAVLFPAIVRGFRSELAMPIARMEAEHVEHGQSLERLRALAHEYVPPAHACTSWRALYLRCEQFEADLMAHVHLENNVLFPRVLEGGA